jgi:hypothetical protein
MSADFASFGVSRIIRLSWTIPACGLWVADVATANELPLPAVATLQVGNLAMVGAVFRQGNVFGRTEARIVGGFGGWSKALSPRGYSLPFGVTKSMVLQDAALEAGELVSVVLDGSLGTHWARPTDTRTGKCPAGRVLRAVAGTSWWVDATGTVQVAPRVPSTVVPLFDVVEWDAAGGIFELAAEDVASWQPGATFVSAQVPTLQTIAAVRHVVDNTGRHRMRVVVQ